MYRVTRNWFSQYRGFLLSGFSAAVCVFVVRAVGLLQLVELAAFDRLIQSRPPEFPDDRIVLVGFSEADFQALGRSEITDQAVAEVITRVRAQKPRVIGLDLYRNLATPPGYEQLLQVFRTTPNLIGIEKVISNVQGEEVVGNPVLDEANRIAASDVIADVDGRVRRGFLFPSTEPHRVIESLGLRVALEYLAAQGITPAPDASVLHLGQVRFPRFEANDGAYRNADDGGYQILLNLRGRRGTFQLIKASEILSGKIPADLFRDRIVMIGDVSVGSSDLFFTSYSSASGSRADPMSGVELHANLASQIISAVLDGRSLIQTVPAWAEWGAIISLAYLSAWLNGRRWTVLQKTGMSVGLMLSVIGIGYVALLWGWWLPLVPWVAGIAIAAAIRISLEAQQLSILSHQDSLTNLANRRSFDEALQREWYRALRSQTPLSLILCDVDFFKSYNDTYGHSRGDDCLRQVAIALQQSVRRPTDLVARYGGEEFVVLLPNTDAYGALKVAKLIQERMQELQILHSGSQVSPFVTVSLGAATILPSLEVTPSVLIEVADAGLYEAKQKGRNQAVLKLP